MTKLSWFLYGLLLVTNFVDNYSTYICLTQYGDILYEANLLAVAVFPLFGGVKGTMIAEWLFVALALPWCLSNTLPKKASLFLALMNLVTLTAALNNLKIMFEVGYFS